MVEAYDVKNNNFYEGARRIDDQLTNIKNKQVQKIPEKRYERELKQTITNFQFLYSELRYNLEHIEKSVVSFAKEFDKIKTMNFNELKKIESRVNSYSQEKEKIDNKFKDHKLKLENYLYKNIIFAIERYRLSFERFKELALKLEELFLEIDNGFKLRYRKSLKILFDNFKEINLDARNEKDRKEITYAIYMLELDKTKFYNTEFMQGLNLIKKELDEFIDYIPTGLKNNW